MKLNTVLLTSAATLMATSVAFAADLPSKKAAPASGSVQVCKVAGKTGFQLPGSDTCVVLSGYVWAEVKFGSDLLGSVASATEAADDNYRGKVREQLNVDAYSNTEMGVLASHIAIRGNYEDIKGSSFAIPSAYLQLGGLTVGLLDSTFGMLDGSPSLEAYNHTPSTTPIQIGYSAKLGNGVTLGVALEQVRSTYSYTLGSYSSYSGNQRVPDLVGTIDFALSNVDIHVGVAYHDNNAGVGYDYDAGYAFDLGAKFNLDSIAKGDSFAVEYAYTDGAAGRISHLWNGAYAYDSNSSGDLTTGYSVGAQFTHVFSSNLKGNVFGGFSSVTYNGDSYSYDDTLIGVNLDYQPVKNFHVKPEFYVISEKGYGSDNGAVLRIQRDF